jgi:hypothetical protein
MGIIKQLLKEYSETQPDQSNIQMNNGIRINNITYTHYIWSGNTPQRAAGTFDKKIQGVDLNTNYGVIYLQSIDDKNDLGFNFQIKDGVGKLSSPINLEGNILSELVKKFNFIVGSNVFKTQNISIGQPKQEEPQLNNFLRLNGVDYTEYRYKDLNTQQYYRGNINERLTLNDTSNIFGNLSLQSNKNKELNINIIGNKITLPNSLILNYNDMENLIKTVNGIFNRNILNRNNLRNHIALR